MANDDRKIEPGSHLVRPCNVLQMNSYLAKLQLTGGPVTCPNAIPSDIPGLALSAFLDDVLNLGWNGW